jgi:site-specific DNA-adenine methylase
MWSYFGSKVNVVDLYPAPKYSRIIEPFAGSAQYALKYWDRDILLVDKYELIVKLWKWLQIIDEGYIRNLPRLETGQSVDEFEWDCEEAKWLVGMIIAVSVAAPRKTASKWTTAPIRPNRQHFKINQIADNLKKIRKWEIRQGSYEDIHNEEATWFIDPPYQKAGTFYIHGSKDIDYQHLADWCKSRNGQAIVCEDASATWLPFYPLRQQHGARRNNMEAIWSNLPHDFMARQAPLFSQVTS